MCGEMRFFICSHCGNIIGMIKNVGVNVVCCGAPMQELVANTVDASKEKHVPVIAVDGNNVKVSVGSVAHPMTDDHNIQWVYILTEKGGQRKCLNAGDSPELNFALTGDDKLIAAYAYCNLHGLWKAEL